MITKGMAINSLMPNAEFVVRNGVVEWIKPTVAPLTDNQINAEVHRLQTEYDAKDYQRKRAKAYPSIADQLDILYHGGYDAWKSAIQAVKQEFPK